MINARQLEHVKNCMNFRCRKPIETFVRVDDKMFCSVNCAQDEGSLAEDFKPEDVIIFSKGIGSR